eukprot:m.172086 g.172086  ORF g.172086 m.172086 type:complete len:378 (+) comp16511_c0_seq7:192-1325(+)
MSMLEQSHAELGLRRSSWCDGGIHESQRAADNEGDEDDNANDEDDANDEEDEEEEDEDEGDDEDDDEDDEDDNEVLALYKEVYGDPSKRDQEAEDMDSDGVDSIDDDQEDEDEDDDDDENEDDADDDDNGNERKEGKKHDEAGDTGGAMSGEGAVQDKTPLVKKGQRRSQAGNKKKKPKKQELTAEERNYKVYGWRIIEKRRAALRHTKQRVPVDASGRAARFDWADWCARVDEALNNHYETLVKNATRDLDFISRPAAGLYALRHAFKAEQPEVVDPPPYEVNFTYTLKKLFPHATNLLVYRGGAGFNTLLHFSKSYDFLLNTTERVTGCASRRQDWAVTDLVESIRRFLQEQGPALIYGVETRREVEPASLESDL